MFLTDVFRSGNNRWVLRIERQEAVHIVVDIATLSPSVSLSYLASIPVVKAIILVNKHCSHPSSCMNTDTEHLTYATHIYNNNISTTIE